MKLKLRKEAAMALAAPDMYSALEACLKVAPLWNLLPEGSRRFFTDEIAAARALMDAALKKARGE
jgi:hypothetical protein